MLNRNHESKSKSFEQVNNEHFHEWSKDFGSHTLLAWRNVIGNETTVPLYTSAMYAPEYIRVWIKWQRYAKSGLTCENVFMKMPIWRTLCQLAIHRPYNFVSTPSLLIFSFFPLCVCGFSLLGWTQHCKCTTFYLAIHECTISIGYLNWYTPNDIKPMAYIEIIIILEFLCTEHFTAFFSISI